MGVGGVGIEFWRPLCPGTWPPVWVILFILRSALPSSNIGASVTPPPLLLAPPPLSTHSSYPYNVCQPASMTAPKAVKIWLALVLVACWVYSSLSRSPSFEDCVASSSFSPWDDEGVEFVFNASGECPAPETFPGRAWHLTCMPACAAWVAMSFLPLVRRTLARSPVRTRKPAIGSSKPASMFDYHRWMRRRKKSDDMATIAGAQFRRVIAMPSSVAESAAPPTPVVNPWPDGTRVWVVHGTKERGKYAGRAYLGEIVRRVDEDNWMVRHFEARARAEGKKLHRNQITRLRSADTTPIAIPRLRYSQLAERRKNYVPLRGKR